MNVSMAAACGVGLLVLLTGCHAGPAPGVDSTTYPAGNQPSDHAGVAQGFGLGPQDFKSNGGAFGPDNGDR